MAATAQQQDADKAERKRLKKLKKMNKAAAAGATEAEAEDAGPAAEEAPAPELTKAERKALKKQKRAADKGEGGEAAADAPAAAAPEAADAAAAAPSKKKQKKGHAAGVVTAAPAGDGMAVVGDRSLASSRKPVVKLLYTESAEVAATPAAAVAAWQAERATSVEGSALRPITAFRHTGLSPAELHATRTFAQPSPIQAQCLPIALSGADLVGIAATGSGKTLAFGLPAIRHIRAQREAGVASGTKPIVLAIAPTRELALQIHAVLEEAGSQVGVKSVCVYGGVPKREQIAALRGGASIVVATPGRLEDLMNDAHCK